MRLARRPASSITLRPVESMKVSSSRSRTIHLVVPFSAPRIAPLSRPAMRCWARALARGFWRRRSEQDQGMTIGTSLFLIAVGAILRYAVQDTWKAVDIPHRRLDPDDRRLLRFDPRPLSDLRARQAGSVAGRRGRSASPDALVELNLEWGQTTSSASTRTSSLPPPSRCTTHHESPTSGGFLLGRLLLLDARLMD